MEADIVARLAANAAVAAIVSARIYFGTARQDAALPYLVLQTISESRFPASSGPTALVSARLQVDCYAVTSLAARALADAVRLSLNGLSGTVGSSYLRSCLLESVRVTTERPLSGQERGPDRVSQDYMIQYFESLS